MIRTFQQPFKLLALVGATSVAAGVALANNTSGVPVPSVPKFDKSNPAKYGKDLAYYMDRRDSGWVDSYSKARVTLKDANGDTVRREITYMALERKEGDQTLVRFHSPPDIRGVAALIHQMPGASDDTWLYLPASRRTRRISGANRTASFQGTEFTYEDLAGLTVQNYKWRFLEEVTADKQPYYKLEAKPNYKDTGYSKLIVYIHRKHWQIEKIEYFDKANRRLKTYAMTNWKVFHGRFRRAQKHHIVNHQTKKSTVVEMDPVYLSLAHYKGKNGAKRSGLKASHFTTRALGR
jgi:hypothetical protein